MNSDTLDHAKWLLILLLLTVGLGAGYEASAESEFVNLIPNGTLNDSNTKGDGCGHCHLSGSSTRRNPFGSRWGAIGWGPQLAGEDSDGDHVPNGWELGDPQGSWKNGDSAPGSPALVTSPGLEESVPPVLAVTPLEIDHFETQGENSWETFTVENVGGDCSGNPTGACLLSADVTTAEAWMSFDPEVVELAPLETAMVDILFTTDGLLGDLEGTATIAASDVLDSPQDVLVVLTVPEPEATALGATALLVMWVMAFESRRLRGSRPRSRGRRVS